MLIRNGTLLDPRTQLLHKDLPHIEGLQSRDRQRPYRSRSTCDLAAIAIHCWEPDRVCGRSRIEVPMRSDLFRAEKNKPKECTRPAAFLRLPHRQLLDSGTREREHPQFGFSSLPPCAYESIVRVPARRALYLLASTRPRRKRVPDASELRALKRSFAACDVSIWLASASWLANC